MSPVFTSAQDCVYPLLSKKDSKTKFLGTAFSLWSSDFWVSAAHCLDGITDNDLCIQFGPDHSSEIRIIIKHDVADIVIMQLTGSAPFQQNYFRQVVPADEYGFEFNTYGYPEDTMGPNAGMTVPRFFKGHYQRVFDHNSHMGYSCHAAELSIACPGGLSGGPIINPENPTSVAGIVCENLESSLWLNTIEVADGERDNHYKMLNYGVALQLYPLKDWLETHISRQR